MRKFYSMAVAGVLSVLSIAINSVGAFSQEASSWNVNPNIDATPERLWSWRRAQFLAPFVERARGTEGDDRERSKNISQ